jgi:hypothetical protein
MAQFGGELQWGMSDSVMIRNTSTFRDHRKKFSMK